MSRKASPIAVSLTLAALALLGLLAWWLMHAGEDSGPRAVAPAPASASGEVASLPPALPSPTPAAVETIAAEPSPAARESKAPELAGGAGPRRDFGIRVLDRDGEAAPGATVSLWTRDAPHPFAAGLEEGRAGYFARHAGREPADGTEGSWDFLNWSDPSWQQPEASVATDENGLCRLALPQGLLLVAATLADHSASTAWFGDAWQALAPPADAAASVDAASTDLVLGLTPRCRLTGQVVDATEQPVVGAIVHFATTWPRKPNVQTVRHPLPVLTGADGRFEVRVDAPNFVMAVAQRGTEWSTFQPIGFRDREEGPIVLRLGTPCSITGMVLAPDGRPAAAAQVCTRSSDGTRESTACDADGHFELRLPHGGEWLLGAVRKPLLPEEVVTVTIPLGAAQAETALRLVEPSRITGRVTWSTGEPGIDFEVAAMVGMGGQSSRVGDVVGLVPFKPTGVTDSNGRFELEGIHPALTYWVTAKKEDEGAETKHTTDTRAGAAIELTIDKEASGLGSIVGTVKVAGTDMPVTDFLVQLTHSANHDLGWSTADWIQVRDADGRFRFDGLPRKPIFVQARAPGFSVATVGPIVPLSGGIEVTVELGTAAELVVVVKDHQGRAAAGATVLLMPQPRESGGMLSSKAPSAPADATGRCTWSKLVPGSYLAQALDGTGCSPVTHVEIGSGSRSSCELVLGQPDRVGSVEVTAVGKGGGPQPGVSVTLIPIGGMDETDYTWLSHERTTDDAGVARFPAVPAGSYMAQGLIDGRPAFSTGLIFVEPAKVAKAELRRGRD